MEWNYLLGIHIILYQNSFVVKMIEVFKSTFRGNSIHELIRLKFFMKTSVFRKLGYLGFFSFMQHVKILQGMSRGSSQD